ncbi:MAG: ATP-binding protein [Candidatus Thiodiazotropha taylori]|nr:ATP-binding protein [Candidatus Thiodiazotropha taylori]MCG7969722.1 ATP-binding protein [Candidatus Thiodiazotropha taylori]
MRIESHDKDVLKECLLSSEDKLIELILNYAERQHYTKYTSTLKEAWRRSIDGLSQSIIATLEQSDQVPELGPDEDYSSDSSTEFGVVEAQRHRARGVNLSMFLGLMKYYRQAYLDLVEAISGLQQPATVKLLINRVYDRIELAYCSEWSGTDSESQIKDLSDSNLHLTNEKNKYLTLFESLSSPVILCDIDGKVDNYNNAAGRLLLGTNTPGSRYYAERRSDLDPPALQQELARMVVEGNRQLDLEKVYQTPDGEKTYHIRIEQMLDVSHKFSGYTILFNDITERLQWSKQLEEINHRQTLLIEDLNQTRQQLVQSEKMAAVGQLSAGIAHEINTPTQYIGDNTRFLQEACSDLQSLSGGYKALLQAAKQGQVDQALIAKLEEQLAETEPDYLFEEIPGAINQSLEGVDKIAAIVSAMKVFAGPEAQEKVETDINLAIDSTLNVSTNVWKYHAEIVTELDPRLPSISCIPQELNQALLNIIVNAVDAITAAAGDEEPAQKGRITIRTVEEDEWVVIEVSDTGGGIPEDLKSKIFDPFFTTKALGKGIGQGLNVVYHTIVVQHGGAIDVQSEVGKGTTFQIRLPRTPQTDSSNSEISVG